MNKIEPRNLDTVESPIINNFQAMIFKDRLDYWYLVLTDSVQAIEYDMECDNFDQAVEMFNLEVNYIRDHGKLRDVFYLTIFIHHCFTIPKSKFSKVI